MSESSTGPAHKYPSNRYVFVIGLATSTSLNGSKVDIALDSVVERERGRVIRCNSYTDNAPADAAQQNSPIDIEPQVFIGTVDQMLEKIRSTLVECSNQVGGFCDDMGVTPISASLAENYPDEGKAISIPLVDKKHQTTQDVV